MKEEGDGVKVYLVREHEMIACVDCGTRDTYSVHLTRESAQAAADQEGMHLDTFPCRVVEEWETDE